MNRNAVAIASSLLFVLLAAIVVLVPAPYVTWKPGTPIDVLGASSDGPLIKVSGIETHEVGGELLMTFVRTSKSTANVSLPEAMLAYFSKGSDAMPRDYIYPPGKSDDEISREAVASMDTSRNHAVVAALRAAGVPVTEHPMVASVVVNGPAGQVLQPGDLVHSVGETEVGTTAEVADAVSKVPVGSVLELGIERAHEEQVVSVTTAASSQDPNRSIIGISLAMGYEYTPTVEYGISDNIVGPSAGMVFALGIYDRITPGHLFGDRIVAGTGEIDPNGSVGAIGGIQEKIQGAQDAGASVFLLPTDNCESVAGFETDLRLVPVATLRDAIAALQSIQEGNEAEVASCG